MAAEDEMVGWHHQLSGHVFEQALGGSEGQGRLPWCNSWGCKELDMTATEQFLHVLLYEVSPISFQLLSLQGNSSTVITGNTLLFLLGILHILCSLPLPSWCFHGLDVLLNKLVVS